MSELESLRFEVDDVYKLSDMDLTHLYELQNLEYLRINFRTAWSAEWDELEYESLKEKLIQEIQDGLPDCEIYIG